MGKLIVYGPKSKQDPRPAEEVKPEIPAEEEQGTVEPVVPEEEESDDSDGTDFEYPQPNYTPEEVKQETIPTLYSVVAITLAGILVMLAVILLTRPTKLPIDIQQYVVECSEDGRSMLLFTDDPQHTRVDVYKDNELVEYPQAQVNGGIRIDNVDPGMYVVHAITVTRSYVGYGLVQVNLQSASKYVGLTSVVADAVRKIKEDPDKKEHCIALYQNYEKHSLEKTTDIEELLRSTNSVTNEVLGFNAPDGEEKLTNECEWYTIFKPNGVIDTYLKERDIFITTSNYKYILAAIAQGLQEGSR